MRQTGGRKLLRMGEVGRKKNILRRTVQQLLCERSGGTEGRDERHSRSPLVCRGEGREHRLQISRSGDMQLLLLRGAGKGGKATRKENQSSGDAAA